MKRTWGLTAAAVFAVTLVLGTLVGGDLLAVSDETRDHLRAYTELMNVAHEHYGAPVSYEDLVFASVGGMIRTLDPHTSFLPPRAYQTMRDKQQSSFFGLGILVGMRNNRLTVITPIEGTPASKLGIRAGDVIDTIEGEPTEQMTSDEAVSKLKGPKGTKVNITIVRRGLEEPLPMQVTRAEIPQTTVRHAYMLDDETGYIWLTDFARGTGDEVSQAIEDLRAQGMTRLLFDLRNNGGGLLDQAIDVADHFVPEGAPIVETRGRTRDSFAEYPDSGVHDLVELPIIVLVNSGTASAAEIVAGAIQDHDVGLIVGNPTWGKGLVQTVYNLPYGAGMALTTARYYTPTGRLIQRDYTSYYDYYRNFAGPTAVDGAADEEGTDDTSSPEENDVGREDEPVFRTDLGRPVYGGGGITPDHAVDDAELSRFSQLLLSRNAHFDFAVDLTRRLGEVGQVDRDWTPADGVLEEFEAWLVAEEIATAEQAAEGLADPDDAEDARRRVRSEVMNALYGQDESHRVRSAGDLQIQRALELFDEAEQLLARRLALEEDTRVAEGLRTNSSPAERADGER